MSSSTSSSGPDPQDDRSAASLLPLLIVFVDVVITMFVFPHLPPRLPMHWNIRGQVDGYGSRELAAVFFPLFALVLWLVLRALPHIDPRRQNYAKFAATYDIAVASVVGVLVLVHLAVLAAGLGVPISIDRVMPALLGGLFIVLGNVLPRARSNWWFGVRTPWTLSNDRVWMRTHRVGGHLMVLAGLACVVGAFLPQPAGTIVLIVATAGSSLGAVVYSYFAWKQETSQ